MDRVPAAVSQDRVIYMDLREETVQGLPARVEAEWRTHGPGLLTASRRPSKRWAESLLFARPLTLSSAPLFELVLWVDRDRSLDIPREERDEQAALLGGYKAVFAGEMEPAVYSRLVSDHIARQEKGLFLDLNGLAPIDRATRELGYEHRGLEKGLLRLDHLANLARAGELVKADRDRLDLDYFHLLEHHLERERDALYPAWVFLKEGVDRP